MSYKLQSLNISLKNAYADPGPKNPLVATLKVTYDKSDLKVELPEGTAEQILALTSDVVAEAAAVQMADFQRAAMQAISLSQPNAPEMIEGEVSE